MPSTISGTQYRVITDNAPEPVTLEFFKKHARIDFDTDDELCTQYIKAARIVLEQYCQMTFKPKTMSLTALEIPCNYKLMYGPVNNIVTTGYTNIGDILKQGGKDVEIQYTTLGQQSEDVKIAICRMATGLYIFRENILESKYKSSLLYDEAKKMVDPYKNLIWF